MEKGILIGKAFKGAWQNMKKNWLVLVGLTVVLLAVVFLLQFLFGANVKTTTRFPGDGSYDFYAQTIYAMKSQAPLNILSTLVGVAFWVIFIPVLLDCVRGKEPAFKFSLSKYLGLLLFSVLATILILLISGISILSAILILSIPGIWALPALGLSFFTFIIAIPLFVFFIYIMLRIMFYSYIYLDEEKNMNLIDSIKESWRLTKGNTLDIFIFLLACCGCLLFGLLALIVGILWAMPLIYLAQAYVYQQLLNLDKAQTTEPLQTEEIEEIIEA